MYCFGKSQSYLITVAKSPYLSTTPNLGGIDPTTGEILNRFLSYLIEYSDTFLGREKKQAGKANRASMERDSRDGAAFICFYLTIQMCCMFVFPSPALLSFSYPLPVPCTYCKVGVSKNVL